MNLTDVLSKKLNVDPAKAEKLKCNPESEAPKVQGAVEDELEDICQDVKISIDFFENQNDATVDEIMLTGGASTTVGLRECMDRMVGKPLSLWNPTKDIPQELGPDAARELQVPTPLHLGAMADARA